MTWIAVGVTVAGAAVSGGEAIYAEQQRKKADIERKQDLAKLSQISPELQQAYDRSLKMSAQGFTPEQIATHQADVGRQQSTSYQQALSASGGQQSQAINAALKSENIEGANKFAAEDAEKRMRNIQYSDQLARAISEHRDMTNEMAYKYAAQTEQAYGQAEAQAISNIAGAAGAGAKLASGMPPKTKYTNPNEIAFNPAEVNIDTSYGFSDGGIVKAYMLYNQK